MKKILILIVLLQTITLNSYSAELKDCSIYSKFNPQYFACKTANIAKSTINYQNEQWSGDKKNNENKKD